MATPLVDTPIPIARNANAIRLRFDQPFAQDQHVPTTHGAQRRQLRAPQRPDRCRTTCLNGVPFVPGTLTIESADTDSLRPVSPESPYSPATGRLAERALPHRAARHERPAERPAAGARPNTSGVAFDGEAIAPAGGVISGDNTAGGDFVGAFVIGVSSTDRTRCECAAVDFVPRTTTDGGTRRFVASPLRADQGRPAAHRAIRIRFTKPLRPDGPTPPTTHGVDDADFRRHNVQVLAALPREARSPGSTSCPAR